MPRLYFSPQNLQVIIWLCRSGIGFQTAETLVQLGATVYLAARNEKKAQDCIKKIEDKLGESAKGKAIFHHLDLADPKDAKESAENFMQRVQRLDILSELINVCLFVFDVSFLIHIVNNAAM